MAVDLVTIHHEGGGAPSDDVFRFAHGGYCYGIGVTLFERFRAPADGWATMNFNGQDLTICLSGDRTTAPITDNDLELIHGAYLDCYNRGEVTAAPLVRAHRDSPGSATACPGNQTMARWADVAAACRASGAPTTGGGGDDMPKDKDYVDAYATPDGAWKLQYDGGVATVRGRFYGSYFSLSSSVRNDPARRFLTICAPADGSAHGYSLVSVKGEVYTFNKAQ
jgi:hypothetical protein